MDSYTLDLSVSEKYFSPDNIIRINKQSDIDMHKEVYKLAKYFKEELRYDSVPFCPYGQLPEEYKVLLFTEEALDMYENELMPYRIYGACLFSRQNFKEDGDYWVLKWIWFHPFFRNRGNLKKNWNKLEEEFGNFLIGAPISNGMEDFLKKTNSIYAHIEI